MLTHTMLLSSAGGLSLLPSDEETYSFHLALLEPIIAAKSDVPQSQAPAFLHDIFDTLPDSAFQGEHIQLQRAQRQYHRAARSQKQTPSPLDIRFGPIRIDWADRMTTNMASQSAQSSQAAASTSTSQPSPAATKRKKKRVFHSQQPQVSVPIAKFEQTDSFEGDPTDHRQLASVGEKFEAMSIGVTEVAFGIVHLFRDKQEAGAAPSDPSDTDNQIPDADVGSIVAVLAVPAHMTASDFLSFVEPAVEAVTQLRMIRDMHPNRCMVLIKFRDPQDAQDFHKMFNGQPFNAMDPEEICQVVYVTSVSVSKQSTLPLTYPTLSNSDPWPLRSAATPLALGQELPTCPVCLERMDSSVTGLMTISCQHTFHCSCLSKWGESRCPVCRYSQSTQRATPSSPSRRPRPGSKLGGDSDDSESEEHELSLCALCETQQDLWVCLICASVGCGRYKQGHAHQHFDETGHLYSLELETQRVWDYAGDGYVHRLIQNKADGKLVELPSASSAAATPERSRRLPHSDSSSATPLRGGATAHVDLDSASGARSSLAGLRGGEPASGSSIAANEKIEAIGLEYSYLLTSQLESQRHFYEEKLDDVQVQLSAVLDKVAALSSKASLVDSLTAQSVELKRDNETLKRDKEKADKRADKALEIARRFESEVSAERSISKGLMTRLEKIQTNNHSLDAKIADLTEQVSDLMFFVQAREKVDQEGGEAQGGQLEIASPPPKSRKGKHK